MKEYWNSRARALPWGTDPTWFEVHLGQRSWAIPELRTVNVAGGDSDPSYSVTFHTSESGVRVVEFAFRDPWGPGLTAKRLRSARYADCIRVAFEDGAVPLGPDGSPATGFFGIDLSDMTRAVDPSRRRRGRPLVVGADEYEQAAALYRQAQGDGRPTTEAVAQGLGVSASTARKRVMGARERGYLSKVNGYTRPSARMGPAEREAVLSGLPSRVHRADAADRGCSPVSGHPL